MSDIWLQKWNERYQQDDYVYGTDPNVFLREQLEKLNPGTILFPAEGEGRNAVFAARSGWTVSAFDIAVEGRNKALRLAKDRDVKVEYQIGQLPSLDFQAEQFDAIALIYAHFPAEIKSAYHKQLSELLRPGGTVILEAFGKNHLAYRERNPGVGGPRDLATLCSTDELRADFEGYEIIELQEKEIELNEGLYHIGKGSVVRFVGRKPASA